MNPDDTAEEFCRKMKGWAQKHVRMLLQYSNNAEMIDSLCAEIERNPWQIPNACSQAGHYAYGPKKEVYNP